MLPKSGARFLSSSDSLKRMQPGNSVFGNGSRNSIFPSIFSHPSFDVAEKLLMSPTPLLMSTTTSVSPSERRGTVTPVPPQAAAAAVDRLRRVFELVALGDIDI